MAKTPLWAIIGAYNEVDIIAATVSNAFAQGAERVLLVDNGSSDRTTIEALKAGAEIAHTFETDMYDEMQRIRIMNDLVERQSEESEHEEIWWLWLDCDELPCGPSGERIFDFVNRLPDMHRIVGAVQINHFPRAWPQYEPGFHPWDFMPDCEAFDTTTFPAWHCKQRHWKHPLHKYVRGRSAIRAKSGFHMGLCDEPLSEPDETIELHHFPYRARSFTYDRYMRLCGVTDARNTYNDATSPDQKSALTKRFEMLDNVYDGRWDKVDINPAPLTISAKVIGVNPKPQPFAATRWYAAEDVRDPDYFINSHSVFLLSGDEKADYSGLILASVMSEIGGSVELICSDPDQIEAVRRLTATDHLPVSAPDTARAANFVFVAAPVSWALAEVKRQRKLNSHCSILSLSDVDVPDNLDRLLLSKLDSAFLPGARYAPLRCPWAERDDVIVVDVPVDDPGVADALVDLFRPEFGGLEFAFTYGIGEDTQPAMRKLYDAAKTHKIGLWDIADITPIKHAELLSKARFFIAGFGETTAICRDALRIGLPVKRVDGFGVTTPFTPSVKDNGLSLTQHLLREIQSGAPSEANTLNLAARSQAWMAAAKIGDVLFALTSSSQRTPRKAPGGHPAREVQLSKGQDTAALELALSSRTSEVQHLGEKVRLQEKKMRSLRRQRTYFALPLILLTFPISVPLVAAILIRKKRKRKRAAARLQANANQGHSEGSDHGPGSLHIAAFYDADRRWMNVHVSCDVGRSDTPPRLVFSSGRNPAGLAISPDHKSRTSWIFDGLSTSVIDGETVYATLSGDDNVRSPTIPIEIRNPNLPPSIEFAKTAALPSMMAADLAFVMAQARGRAPQDADRKSPEVVYYPRFETEQDLADHYFRAQWYLGGNGSSVDRISFWTSHEAPSVRPVGFSKNDTIKSENIECIDDETAYVERLFKAKIVLIWKSVDRHTLEFIREAFPGSEVLTVATDDPMSPEFERYCIVQWLALAEKDRARVLTKNALKLKKALSGVETAGSGNAVVIGTGTSTEQAFEYDFSDCLTVVCGTLISNPKLMKHIQPDFICAGDVVSHFGVSEYAERFRRDLELYLSQSGAFFLTTARIGYVLTAHYPHLSEKIILCDQLTDDPVIDLNGYFALPRLGSTLNTLMLPLASTFADRIYLLGFDGRNPNADENDNFWAHSELAHYRDLIYSSHAYHPTFNSLRQAATYTRFVKSTEQSFVAGEMWGKRYYSLTASHIPALKARPAPERVLTKSEDAKTRFAGPKNEPAFGSRLRVCIVMQCPHALFSGGRYHACMLAEALASSGYDVVVWMNNYPAWLYNFNLHSHHEHIQFVVNGFHVRPEGNFDAVFIVPDMSNDATLYKQSLAMAKSTGAVTVLVNFESPNWFNEGNKTPRPEERWKHWQATSAFSDVVVSSANTSADYARQYYQPAEDCVFAVAPPSINTPAADLVRAMQLKPEQQIICISRFGAQSEHKNIESLTALLSEATRGYTFALIVGTASLPEAQELETLRDAFAEHDVTLKLLHGISDIEKFEQIARSKCMVFPSLFEGFGYPPIECLYMGRPCIAYDLPVLREFSGGLPTFVPKGDTDAMRMALAAVLNGEPPDEDVLHDGVASVAHTEHFAARLEAFLNPIYARAARASAAYSDHAFDRRSQEAADKATESRKSSDEV